MLRFAFLCAAVLFFAPFPAFAENEETTPILGFEVWFAGRAPERAHLALDAFVKAGAQTKIVDNGATIVTTVNVDDLEITQSGNTRDTDHADPCYGKTTFAVAFLDKNTGAKVDVNELADCKAHLAKDLVNSLDAMADSSIPYQEHMHSDVTSARGKRIEVEQLVDHGGTKAEYAAKGIFCYEGDGSCQEADQRRLEGQSSENGLRDEQNRSGHFTDVFAPIVQFTHDGANAKALYDLLVAEGAKVVQTYEGSVIQIDNVSLTLDDGYEVPGYQTPCYAKKTYAYSYIDRNWNDTVHATNETSECTATNASALVNAFLPLGALRVFGPEDRLGRLYAEAYGVKVVYNSKNSGDEVYQAMGNFCTKSFCSIVTK